MTLKRCETAILIRVVSKIAPIDIEVGPFSCLNDKTTKTVRKTGSSKSIDIFKCKKCKIVTL